MAGQQTADVVLAAAVRIAREGDGSVTLSQVQADENVQARVRSPARVLDFMAVLERESRVRMTVRGSDPRWTVTEAA